MIVTGISVGSNGNVNLGPAPTFGILLGILFSHAVVCSAGNQFIARLTLVYSLINGAHITFPASLVHHLKNSPVGTTIAAAVALLVLSGNHRVSAKDAFTLLENNTGWSNGLCQGGSMRFFSHIHCLDGWAFLLSFTAPMWTLTGCEHYNLT